MAEETHASENVIMTLARVTAILKDILAGETRRSTAAAIQDAEALLMHLRKKTERTL